MKYLILIIALLALSPLVYPEATRGTLFPPLQEDGLTGAEIPDTAGKVVLVDFCASWCAPCRASFPAYSRLQQEFGPKGLVIIGVSIDTDPDKYQAMVKKLRPGFTVLNDPSHKLVSKVQVPSMPTSYLIDRSGHIAGIRMGFHSGETESDLRDAIKRLLAQNQS